MGRRRGKCPLGAVVVAVDHSDTTLLRYVRPDITPNLTELRRSLLRLATLGGADSLVVAHCDIAWAATTLPDMPLIIGLPDKSSVQPAAVLLRDIDCLKPAATMPIIKHGFRYRPREYSQIIDALDSHSLLDGKAKVIYEPYFDAGVTFTEQIEVLQAIAARTHAFALKISTADSEHNAKEISKALRDCTWYVRSDGKDFPTFRDAIRLESTWGCDGAIAGAAIWRSLLPWLGVPARRTELEAEIHGRIKGIRQLFEVSSNDTM